MHPADGRSPFVDGTEDNVSSRRSMTSTISCFFEEAFGMLNDPGHNT